MGLENTTPALQAIHDHTAQGRAFAYASTLNDDNSRTSIITGWWQGKFQIPNTPGQRPQFAVDGVGPNDPANNSATLNENQYERNVFGVIAWQKTIDELGRSGRLCEPLCQRPLRPDQLGDLVFNGVASTVFRGAFTNGVQTDAAYRLNDAPHHQDRLYHERGNHAYQQHIFATCRSIRTTGNPGTTPFGVTDPNSQWGFMAGVYLQDEWRLTNHVDAQLRSALRSDVAVSSTPIRSARASTSSTGRGTR